MKNKSRLKGTRILIFEDLTEWNRQILMHAKNHPGIEDAWYFNGKLFAQTSSGRRLHIDTLTDLDNEIYIHRKGH